MKNLKHRRFVCNEAEKRSAVSNVQKSGLKLVRERKSRGRLATMRDYAKLDWEPWPKSDKPGPSSETMNYLGFYCRLSAAMMSNTKAELVKFHEEFENDEIDKLMAGLMDTGEMLKSLASVTECAYARTLAAACAQDIASSSKGKNVAKRPTGLVA